MKSPNTTRSDEEELGKELSSHFGESSDQDLTVEQIVEQIRNRADSTSSVLEGILHRPDSNRRFGIND